MVLKLYEVKLEEIKEKSLSNVTLKFIKNIIGVLDNEISELTSSTFYVDNEKELERYFEMIDGISESDMIIISQEFKLFKLYKKELTIR